MALQGCCFFVEEIATAIINLRCAYLEVEVVAKDTRSVNSILRVSDHEVSPKKPHKLKRRER